MRGNKEELRSAVEYLRQEIDYALRDGEPRVPLEVLRFDIDSDNADTANINDKDYYYTVPCRIHGSAVENGSYEFTWVIPTDTREFTGIADGKKWFSNIILKKVNSKGKEGEEEKEKKGFSFQDKPKLPQDDNHCTIFGSYWYHACRVFVSVVEAYKYRNNGKKSQGKINLTELIKLQANLNSLAAQPRRDLFTGDGSGDVKANSLKKAEEKRAVKIAYKGRIMGRIRRPDITHWRRICPYEIHESKRIGLDLYLSAAAEFNYKKNKIESKYGNSDKVSFDFLSLAVGMVPYPAHSDGPRLMMGGKNLKQAEEGIAGAERALVPGTVEINKDDNCSEVKNLMNENNRFKLGVNALVVLMPYGGYTYEDGLVVSESFAKKLHIPESEHVQEIQFGLHGKNADKGKDDNNEKTKSAADVSVESKEEGNADEKTTAIKCSDRRIEFTKDVYDKIDNFYHNAKRYEGKIYCVGDTLPVPEEIAEYHGGRLHYDSMVAGKLEKFEWIPMKISQTENKVYLSEFTLKYTFTVERPLHKGDKLTGRNGNKGVVTEVIPDDKMPKVEIFGEKLTADVLLTPASVMGRKI